MDCSQYNTTSTMDLFNLCESMNTLNASNVNDINTFFILWAAALVFFMHAGFATLSSGAVRRKNTLNILMCILLDACMCAIAFWFVGYAFAYGTDKGGFIGTTYFVGMDIGVKYSYSSWFFQFAFAATAATIVSGAVAERATFEAYITISFYLSAWIYPVCVHWIWGGGFLTLGNAAWNQVGCFDFAGCGPVHMIGGLAGAIGSKIIGPRIGRFNADGTSNVIPGHSSALAALGTFILWVGWFGFNPGSALTIMGNSQVAERAAVNTMLSSAAGGLSSLCFSTMLKRQREWDLGAAMNGILAGLVAITGSCSVVETWASIIIGLMGGVCYILASSFTLNQLKIDDPLDATAVHLFCGALGIFVVGFFAKPEFVAQIATFSVPPEAYAGVFYGGNGTLLLGQLVEFLCVFAWVAVFVTPYFLLLKRLSWLRVSSDVEHAGIDSSSHGGSAYPEHQELEFAKSKYTHDNREVEDNQGTVNSAGASINQV